MARKITRSPEEYATHKYKYIVKKIRDGKTVSAADMAFGATQALARREPWPPPQPNFEYEPTPSTARPMGNQIPEPIIVPLDGITPEEEQTPSASESGVSSETTGNSSSSRPSTGQSSGSTGAEQPKAKVSDEQARAVGSVFINYLRSCNEQLKKYEGAFVLPEVAFTMLIEPSVHALCEKHAGSIEIGEREQTIVVVASAAATAGQLFYRKRKATGGGIDTDIGDLGATVVVEAQPVEPSPPPATVHSIVQDDGPSPTDAAKNRLLRSLVRSGAFKAHT